MTKAGFTAKWRVPSVLAEDLERKAEHLADVEALIKAAQEAQCAAIRDHLTSHEVTWDNDAELTLVIESVPLAGLE